MRVRGCLNFVSQQGAGVDRLHPNPSSLLTARYMHAKTYRHAHVHAHGGAMSAQGSRFGLSSGLSLPSWPSQRSRPVWVPNCPGLERDLGAPRGSRPKLGGCVGTHPPVAKPLQTAVPTQDTEGLEPLWRAAPELCQGPTMLPHSGQLLEKGKGKEKRRQRRAEGVGEWRQAGQMLDGWGTFE